jgi:hypothetical protein
LTSCGAVTAGGGGGAATVADGNCVTVDVAVGIVPCIWFDWFLISAMNRYNLVFWVFVEFTDKTLIRIVMFDRIVRFFQPLLKSYK